MAATTAISSNAFVTRYTVGFQRLKRRRYRPATCETMKILLMKPVLSPASLGYAPAATMFLPSQWLSVCAQRVFIGRSMSQNRIRRFWPLRFSA